MNYFETYTPVVTWFAIRLMIIFGIIFGWALHQVDFVMAYPHAKPFFFYYFYFFYLNFFGVFNALSLVRVEKTEKCFLWKTEKCFPENRNMFSMKTEKCFLWKEVRA